MTNNGGGTADFGLVLALVALQFGLGVSTGRADCVEVVAFAQSAGTMGTPPRVVGATVTLRGVASGSTFVGRTDASGSACIAIPVGGSYELEIESEKHGLLVRRVDGLDQCDSLIVDVVAEVDDASAVAHEKGFPAEVAAIDLLLSDELTAEQSETLREQGPEASRRAIVIAVEPESGTNHLSSTGEIIASGPFSEIGRPLLERVGSDLVGYYPLTNNFQPAVLVVEYFDFSALEVIPVSTGSEVSTLSTFNTGGGSQSIVFGDPGGSNDSPSVAYGALGNASGSTTAAPLRRLLVYPDPANFVYRIYEAKGGEVTFVQNWPFPPGVTQVGPVFGGAQFRLERLDSGHAAVVASYSRTASDLPGQGACQPFTREAEVRLSVYDAAGSLISDHLVTRIEDDFGVACRRPIWTEAEVLGEGLVATVLAAESGVVLHVTDVESGATREIGLGPLPAELQTTGLFNVGIYGDPRSGALVVDVPHGQRFEFGADAVRLGLSPEESARRDPGLDPRNPVAVNELARSLSGLTRYGVYDQDVLDALDFEGFEEAQRRHSEPGVAGPPVLAAVQIPGCVDDDVVFCANDNRFAITARFETPQGQRGLARARPLTNDSGTFWFFDRSNREVIVKVLEACGLNGHYWFFAAGLTNVGVQLDLGDRLTGEGKIYRNPVGRTFVPILDTEAIPCSPEAVRRAEDEAALVADLRSWHPASPPTLAPLIANAEAATGVACGGDEDDLCLTGDRFRVEVHYTTRAGESGAALGGRLTDETGAFFFFDASNVEMLVKVLDACAFGNYWVFAAGLTNVGVELSITDTVTGEVQRYSNPVGTAFAPITDTGSFACQQS